MSGAARMRIRAVADSVSGVVEEPSARTEPARAQNRRTPRPLRLCVRMRFVGPQRATAPGIAARGRSFSVHPKETGVTP